MQKIKNFDGQLFIKVSQTSKNGTITEKNIVIKGFKVLDTKRIAASIAGAIMTDISIYKKLGKRLFSSTLPIDLHVADGSKHTIFSTATMEQNVKVNIKPRNVLHLQDKLFAALVSIQYKPTVQDMDINDSFVAAHNKTLWNKVAEIAESVESEVVTPE